ncbi:MAG: hypothetical protein JSR95_14690, partial [Proteobacteria bacterium]|nr:hypothetical protein [Pseudomonadota bacterium]
MHRPEEQSAQTASPALLRVERMSAVLAAYTALGALIMLTGIGGSRFSYYAGLLCDAPANLIAVFA